MLQAVVRVQKSLHCFHSCRNRVESCRVVLACIYFRFDRNALPWNVEFLHEMQKSLTKIWFARATQTIHCHHYRQHVAFEEMQRKQIHSTAAVAYCCSGWNECNCDCMTVCLFHVPAASYSLHIACITFLLFTIPSNAALLHWNQKLYIHFCTSRSLFLLSR